nr:PREDICTED: uncharacterized protein LOC107075667 [Lepisosteus oculatus]
MKFCACSPSSGDGGRPFLDIVDAQWRCEGELVPLGSDRLSPREFLVYQHGLYLLGLLRTHTQVPEITLQLAASLPANDYTHNAFRHSFFYQEAEKTLFVRRQRLQGVGGFSLLLLHCLAHIASGELSPDSSPNFLRAFFQTLQVCLGELFLLRLVAPQGESGDTPSSLRDILLKDESCSPDSRAALSALLQDRVQGHLSSPQRLADRLREYSETRIYRGVEGLLRERTAETRRGYRRRGTGGGSVPPPAAAAPPRPGREEHQEPLSSLLRAQRERGAGGSREELLRDIARLETECGLGESGGGPPHPSSLSQPLRGQPGNEDQGPHQKGGTSAPQ